ncbi:arginine N-succinyltransferase [Sphingorhabdus lutea]|uniref:Arginine N-succinyltransferase n=1 Tax=Sphingorhabdus lutea TaxID=1913578 RepID=A0A1L3JCK5_9SPHN|nr:arginine N-succinyltransferase [Sphingorhabdus lutea]APG62860.1 arginine N-succinyltransferase [Sphingorhabdus lutea]
MTYILRPVQTGDVQPIYEMAKSTGGGFTNLPPDKKTLSAKIERSIASFIRVGDEISDDIFMFVLADDEAGVIHGTCQIFASVGQRWPFYSYRISALTQHSEELGRTFRADILNLSTDLEGCTEVGGLYLHPNARSGGLGLLLARSRYLFIRNHRNRFADKTLAELRGVIDPAGSSPFWNGVAGRFFGMSFQEADEFNGKNGNQFIADLMPKHPVYIAMLPDSARAVIGVPHTSGRAAMRMLENENFVWEKYVDIFDGGPTMSVNTDRISTIEKTNDGVISDIISYEDSNKIADANMVKMLICAGQLNDFRCAYGWVKQDKDNVQIDMICAKSLRLNIGDSISFVPRG